MITGKGNASIKNKKQELPTKGHSCSSYKLSHEKKSYLICHITRITDITRIIRITHFIVLNSLHFGQNQYDCFFFLLYTLFKGSPHCGQSFISGFFR